MAYDPMKMTDGDFIMGFIILTLLVLLAYWIGSGTSVNEIPPDCFEDYGVSLLRC